MTTTQQHEMVASSPDSKLEELFGVIEYHPQLVARNPALMLGFVTDPEAAMRLRTQRLAMVVAFEEAPRPLVDLAMKSVTEHPDESSYMAMALLMNRALDPQYVKHAVWALAEARDLNETSVYHRQRYQDQRLNSPVEDVERALSRKPLPYFSGELSTSNLVNSFVPRTYMRKRVGGIEASARWAAAAPLTAPEVLAYMGQSSELSMLRNELASHPNAPPALLAEFLGDPWVEQDMLLKHRHLPASMRLRTLTEGSAEQVVLLASNPSLSCGEQLQIIRSGNHGALPHLAENQGLCDEAARYIAALHHEELGLLLVEREDLADGTVEELMQHPHNRVQWELRAKWGEAMTRILKAQRVPGRSRRRAHEETRIEETSSERARSGSRSPDQGAAEGEERRAQDATVRVPQPILRYGLTTQLLVATSRNVDARILGTLAGSYRALVRLAVAAHPNTPAATLEWLAEDTDVRVAKAAREEPSLPV